MLIPSMMDDDDDYNDKTYDDGHMDAVEDHESHHGQYDSNDDIADDGCRHNRPRRHQIRHWQHRAASLPPRSPPFQNYHQLEEQDRMDHPYVNMDGMSPDGKTLFCSNPF